MAKPLYFWQTVSKRPDLADLAFKKRERDRSNLQGTKK